MALRIWLMLVVMAVAVASLLPGSVFAQDNEEPYSGGTVPATTLATTTTPPTTDPGDSQVTTGDPAATTIGTAAVLGNTLGRGGERLPNTGGFQSGWLAAGALLLITVGISLVWIVRSRTDA
ncbi:MAG: LPXTG cell wall anchor domain-containing protein [Acidimicrobiia bacterium]